MSENDVCVTVCCVGCCGHVLSAYAVLSPLNEAEHAQLCHCGDVKLDNTLCGWRAVPRVVLKHIVYRRKRVRPKSCARRSACARHV